MPEATRTSNDLATAVATGDLDRVTAILDDDPNRVRETAASGRRLLSVAAEFGHTAIAKLLLDRGADPTWSDADARRGAALYEAARTGNRPLVELLLSHGGDPNAHVEASGNAVYAAARYPEIRALLEAHGGTLDPYDLVWLDEDDEVIRRVVADPESAYAGCGGVYTAVVTRGKRDLLMRLLDAGVRVPPTPNGCRSYLLEQPDMLLLLLSRAGLDPDYRDEDGSTLLHALCSRDRRGRAMNRRIECAAILLDAGATISARNKDGITPLALAKRDNLPEMVAFLSARDAE
jgi:ankyrin repeat protein